MFIVVEPNCWSLFVGVVIAFANNALPVDNSRKLVDNVRDKQ